jgi:hypothetical protein
MTVLTKQLLKKHMPQKVKRLRREIFGAAILKQLKNSGSAAVTFVATK